MLTISSIIHDSIVDGPGLRSVIFTQGCLHNCIGCHNQSSLPLTGGTTMSIDEIIKEINQFNFTKKVTLSGGDPLIQKDIVKLCKELKANNYHIVLYTGYTLEEIKKLGCSEVLNYIDMLVDGKFEIKNRDTELQFQGSSNQKIYYKEDL